MIEKYPTAFVIDELRKLFDAHQQNGQVRMDYFTRIYYGQLQASA